MIDVNLEEVYMTTICYCLGPLERGKDGMTSKGGLQRRQHRQTLFAECGQVAANASKGLSESLAAQAAGDFLLHLDHAKISLGQMIVKSTPRSSRKARTACCSLRT